MCESCSGFGTSCLIPVIISCNISKCMDLRSSQSSDLRVPTLREVQRCSFLLGIWSSCSTNTIYQSEVIFLGNMEHCSFIRFPEKVTQKLISHTGEEKDWFLICPYHHCWCLSQTLTQNVFCYRRNFRTLFSQHKVLSKKIK